MTKNKRNKPKKASTLQRVMCFQDWIKTMGLPRPKGSELIDSPNYFKSNGKHNPIHGC